MPWLILALLGLGGAGLYVWHDSQQPVYTSPNKLVPMHWYRVLWSITPVAAQANPAGAQGAVQAAMVAQGFTSSGASDPVYFTPYIENGAGRGRAGSNSRASSTGWIGLDPP